VDVPFVALELHCGEMTTGLFWANREAGARRADAAMNEEQVAPASRTPATSQSLVASKSPRAREP
jgi:hypothetical protein